MSFRHSVAAMGCLVFLGFSPVPSRAQITEIDDIQLYDDSGIPVSPHLGSVVTIRGVLTVVKGTYNTGTHYVQDATGGLAVFDPSAPVFAVGDVVEVTGEVGVFVGENQISAFLTAPTSWILVSSGREPIPMPLTIEQILDGGGNGVSMDQSEDYEVVGLFASTTGFVESISGGFSKSIRISDGSDILTVFVDGTTGIDLSGVAVGDLYEFTGPIATFFGLIEVKPRRQGDLLELDPTAGFATGGGWFDSPPGAFVSDASVAGQATFGFVSKYPAQAVVPTGITEFQFQAAGMNFHSTNYQKLVIANQKAQINGTGTINGNGNLRFVLKAIDGGASDKLRIQIWDRVDDSLVYDNQIGDDDDEDARVEVQGSVVVHKSAPGSKQKVQPPDTELVGFALDNTPNPFNPRTAIRFALPAESTVSLAVYDARGHQVAVLLQGELRKPGRYSVDFDASRLGSGMYFYRLETESRVETRKMMLLK